MMTGGILYRIYNDCDTNKKIKKRSSTYTYNKASQDSLVNIDKYGHNFNRCHVDFYCSECV